MFKNGYYALIHFIYSRNYWFNYYSCRKKFKSVFKAERQRAFDLWNGSQQVKSLQVVSVEQKREPYSAPALVLSSERTWTTTKVEARGLTKDNLHYSPLLKKVKK